MHRIQRAPDKLQLYVIQLITSWLYDNIDMSCWERGNTLDCLCETRKILGTHEWRIMSTRSQYTSVSYTYKQYPEHVLLVLGWLHAANMKSKTLPCWPWRGPWQWQHHHIVVGVLLLQANTIPPQSVLGSSLDSQLHWLCKDVIRAQIGGKYAHLPLDL